MFSTSEMSFVIYHAMRVVEELHATSLYDKETIVLPPLCQFGVDMARRERCCGYQSQVHT